MEEYSIRGGRPLQGTAEVPAAKNSLLPLMAAALLCGGPVTLRGVPALSDVTASCRLIEAVGGAAVWQEDTLIITPPVEWEPMIPLPLARAMRSSVFYLAPLLARAGRVTLPMPGGCHLGPRKIDIHLDGLCRMGARLHWHGDWMTLQAPDGLRGVDYTLRLPSVGATETLLMAAAMAKGSTLLRGVACEPEVVDLARFLNRCGAKISGAGGPVIRVEGVPALSGCGYRPIPDRIAADTLAAAVAIAGGTLTLRSCPRRETADFFDFLRRLGCRADWQENAVTLRRAGGLRGQEQLTAQGYPGFATDALPLAAAVLLTAHGYSTVTDTLFSSRFGCAQGFRAMGGRVQAIPGGLKIQGGLPLRGAAVEAPDLRGGAALLLAALACRGETVLRDEGHLARGYADLPGQLNALGAEIYKR